MQHAKWCCCDSRCVPESKNAALDWSPVKALPATVMACSSVCQYLPNRSTCHRYRMTKKFVEAVVYMWHARMQARAKRAAGACIAAVLLLIITCPRKLNVMKHAACSKCLQKRIERAFSHSKPPTVQMHSRDGSQVTCLHSQDCVTSRIAKASQNKFKC